MPMSLSISAVAARTGLRASAVRYYERMGLLPDVPRSSGQRRYSAALLQRLALIQRMRQLGFTLAEVRQLFHGFPAATPASQRWQELAVTKVTELQATIDSLTAKREHISRLGRCRCETLDVCAARLLQS